MTINLTEQQRQAIEAQPGEPVEVIDPVTNRAYVLVAAETFERTQQVLGENKEAAPQPTIEIPPGIRRSQEAFWSDLPQLLSQKKLRGKCICYRGTERIGVGTYEELIRECVRRGIPDDAYHVDVIEPHAVPPWEPEVIEAGGHEVDESTIFDSPGKAGEPA